MASYPEAYSEILYSKGRSLQKINDPHILGKLRKIAIFSRHSTIERLIYVRIQVLKKKVQSYWDNLDEYFDENDFYEK